jgi:hypothetical protein
MTSRIRRGENGIRPKPSYSSKQSGWLSEEHRRKLSSTPPIRADLLALDDFGRYPGRGRPELEVFDRHNMLDRLAPLVESEVKETPVDGHEKAMTAESAEAANGALRAHVDVGP